VGYRVKIKLKAKWIEEVEKADADENAKEV